MTTETYPAETDAQAPVAHNRPTLTAGAHGPDVDDLVALLRDAGYTANAIAQGVQTVGYLDDTVLDDVRRFCADHHIVEDIKGFIGREGVRAERMIETHVGPKTWQALEEVAAAARRALHV